MLVNFLIAGAMKAGTTTLDGHLRNHPQVRLPRVKELRAFRDPKFCATEYHKNWQHHGDEKAGILCGESTPGYMYFGECVERIKAYNPAMKFVCILREPVARAYSQFWMRASRSTYKQSKEFPLTPNLKSDDFRRGLYADQIQRLYNAFSEDQVLALRTDDLDADHQGTLDKIHVFLGVSPRKVRTGLHANKGSYPPISNETNKNWKAAYADSVAALEKLLGWDLSDWRAA